MRLSFYNKQLPLVIKKIFHLNIVFKPSKSLLVPQSGKDECGDYCYRFIQRFQIRDSNFFYFSFKIFVGILKQRLASDT